MQLSRFLFVSILCLLFCVSSNAQERVKNRAENKANQRVDQKVDQAVDKAADAIEGLFRRKKKNQPTEPEEDGEETIKDGDANESRGGFPGISFGGEFEPYENPIQMNLSLDMTTTDKRGKVQEVTVHYTFDTWATGMEMIAEEGSTRIILDNQEGKMTMVTEDDGETQGIRIRQPQVDYEEMVPDESEYTITDLGNTKVINGYNCREYLIEHEEGTTNTWLTKDIELDREAMIRAMSSQMRQRKNKSSGQQFFDIEGFPIESTTVSKDGKETITATYYNLKFGADMDKSVFDMTGVEVINMGF